MQQEIQTKGGQGVLERQRREYTGPEMGTSSALTISMKGEHSAKGFFERRKRPGPCGVFATFDLHRPARYRSPARPRQNDQQHVQKHDKHSAKRRQLNWRLRLMAWMLGYLLNIWAMQLWMEL